MRPVPEACVRRRRRRVWPAPTVPAIAGDRTSLTWLLQRTDDEPARYP